MCKHEKNTIHEDPDGLHSQTQEAGIITKNKKSLTPQWAENKGSLHLRRGVPEGWTCF